jgi:predicted nucleic acid-binding protein
MVFKAFLDANLLLDFFLKRTSYATAEEILQKAIENRFAAYTTPAVLHINGY